MNIIKKTELLSAMRRILLEYKNGTHRANLDTCALCILYNKAEDGKHRGHECRLCPMHVFHKQNHHYSCMSRKCEPIHCDGNEIVVEIKRVTEFYKKAIAVVKTISAEELNEKNAFKFLMKIDKDIYNEYDW